ncbi:MAG: cysteine desulfurase family protein [Bradymonadaceae bacterium]
MKDPIYLDHNATTPILPEVVDAMLPYLREHFGNPSSGHVFGARAKEAVEKAREQVARLLGCEADEVFFTSGGTEANNLAIRGVTEACRERSHIITSIIEHPATARPCAWLERHDYSVSRLPVDTDGRVRADDARQGIDENTALVTLIHANNETGVLQPVREISILAHAKGALMHTDAAQSVGKVAVDVRDLDVDLLSLAGHKLYAPKGVGALYVRRGTPIAPLVLGAGHERGLRPGTENVASIVGLGAACARAARDLDTEAARVATLRDLLWHRLNEAIPNLAINGHPLERLPNTLNVRFPGISGPALLSQTPEIAASTGSACHEGHDQPSPIILAMGISPQDALGSVRLTLGHSTTADDITRASDYLIRSACSIRSS